MNADLLREAAAALGAHRLRSLLTLLGVIIGVASVVLMLGIGEGSRQRIDASIAQLGTHQLIVTSGGGIAGGLRGAGGTLPTLTEGDAAALTELPSVRSAAPVHQGQVRLVRGKLNRSVQLVGSTPDYLAVQRWALVEGRNFSAQEARGAQAVVLIGDRVRRELFADLPAGHSVVGQMLRVQRQVVEVIGVLEAKGQSLTGGDQDDMIVMPLATAQRRLAGTPFPGSVGLVLVEASDPLNKALTEQEVRGLLRQRHRLAAGVEDDFGVRDLAALSSTLRGVSTVMSVLLGTIAFISLLVGGIGVMNIMLVSVSERTREIGLRLAVGATPALVQRQFLFEALLLTAAGALLGLLLGIGVGLLVSASGAVTVIHSVAGLLLAVGVAAGVGLLFGWWPARRASRLVPAEALRS